MQMLKKVLVKNGWQQMPSMTKEEMECIRVDLEKVTEEAFQKFDQARRSTWAKAKLIVLD